MTNTKNKPMDELRDGSVKAVIWGNSSDHGMRFSVDLVRSYKDANDQWQTTSYLSNGEILKGQRLLSKAYDRILELKIQDRDNDA